MSPFRYQSEKLQQARSSLMLPHFEGEASSIAEAFEFCDRAFHQFDESQLDDNARSWVATIRAFMDTSKVTSSSGRGLWLVRAELLSYDEKVELSRVVDELANWFDMQFWSKGNPLG